MEAGAGAPLLHGATLPAGMTGPQACPYSTPMCLIPGLCLLTSDPLLIRDVDSIWHCMERSRAQSPMPGMQQAAGLVLMHARKQNLSMNTCQNKPERSHCPHLAPTAVRLAHYARESGLRGGPRSWGSHGSRTETRAISRV